ncbi:toll/interleukin-1 receptor domain-containing protein [Actinoplanes sp. Pm04-4]|uniref:Toll/interleukin-1 receptor domain-containing protein n=1 Tax=Paractinoplanes pyxinae TaxID=2997416 RepID=A0ABT4B3B7_9ACTN|nr:toll/interleukin-1 receptor domain-containing protein [Actinoplanes pyxinae]MCY1140098.1 toll/interleukin-1 receptor domain-containing protein [Actinoplanes pyxinae]
MNWAFISYQRDDLRLVEPIVARLREAGVGVWLDRDDLQAGDNWRQAIKRAIREGGAFVPMFSPRYNSRRSTYMNVELREAIEQARQMHVDRRWMVPVMLETCELPDMRIDSSTDLTDLHYVDFTADWNAAMASLIKALRSILEDDREPGATLPGADIPIWDDPDVRRIYRVIDRQPFPNFHVFNDSPHQLQLVRDFVLADQNAGSDGPPAAFVDACLAGIRAVESLAAVADPGWLKFFTFMTDANNHFLWDLYRPALEVGAIASWTVETIEKHGWGPDGNSTAMGQRHSNALGLAAAAGQVPPGTGDRARQAAAEGYFQRFQQS